MAHFWPKNVRTRLTLWYVLVLASLLVLFIAGSSLFLFLHLRSQLDRHAITDIETVEGLLYFEPDGKLRLKEDYHNHAASKQAQDWLLEVLSSDGKILLRNERLAGSSLGEQPFAGEGENGYSPRTVALQSGVKVRLVSRRHLLDGRPILIRLGYGQGPLWRNVQDHLETMLLAFPFALAVAGFSGYKLAKHSLAPLERMATHAEKITSERLHERLPLGSQDDELNHLSRVFNDTLARLEASFEQLRRFTSDASHELRTPLAAIRTVGEVGLQRNSSPEEYRDTIGSMLEEVNRLTRLVDSLLTMSRAESGALHLQRSPLSVMDILRASKSLVEILSEEKGQRLIVQGTERAVVEGDRLFLQQALVNVLHNAVNYTPQGGSIEASVAVQSEQVEVEISDSGPGIPKNQQDKVFDRFYRVDKSRSRDAGGTGLGLSIAKWVVEAHGGSISVSDVPRHGCTIRILLPLAHQIA